MSRMSRTRLALCLSLGLGAASFTPERAWADTPAEGAPAEGNQAAGSKSQGAKERSPEDEARRKLVVAKVDGVEITLGKIEDFLENQPPMMRARLQSRDELNQLVNNMLRVELLAAEAQRRGYDKNVTVVRTVKDSAVQALLRADIDEKFSPQGIPEAEVKRYYDASPAEFHRPAARRASQIVLATEAEAKELLPEAQKSDVRGFAELARSRSIDGETKLRGGDLGYFTKEPTNPQTDKLGSAIRNMAFGLKATGDTATEPVPVASGFAILRLTGERPARNTDLASAESIIRTKLWREQRQRALETLVAKLRSEDKPQVFAERADWVKFDDMDKRPPGFAPERPAPSSAQNPSGEPAAKAPAAEEPGAKP